MTQVLIIEDEQLVRMVLRDMLEAAGHQVTEAEDGEQGLAQFRAQPADIVVTDIVMPRKEGFETIEELRRRHPGVKIIAISGGDPHRGSGTLAVAKGLGAHGVLMKPFRRQELLAMIDDILPTA